MNKNPCAALRFLCLCLLLALCSAYKGQAQLAFRPESEWTPDLTLTPNATQDYLLKKPRRDTALFETSPGVDPKLLTFKQRNSGAFKRRKKGGLKDPGMAVLCSGLVPGLGQIYNGQWWKTPVIYAGGAVAGYFMYDMLRSRRIYDKEISARYEEHPEKRNPDLAGFSNQQILDLRNYYEQYFELTIILSGVWYLLNLMDAAVYAHLSSFNVSPDLSLCVKPYVQPNCYAPINRTPIDAGIRLCFTLK